MRLNCKDRRITNQVTSFPWGSGLDLPLHSEGVQWCDPQDQKYQNPNLPSSLSPHPILRSKGFSI